MPGQGLRNYKFSVMAWSKMGAYREIMAAERAELYASAERVAWIVERYPPSDYGRPFGGAGMPTVFSAVEHFPDKSDPDGGTAEEIHLDEEIVAETEMETAA